MNTLKKEELADIRAWTNTGSESKEVIDILAKEIFNHDISNIHLRHSALSAIHSHLRNYLMCMERNYYGPRSQEEIELTKNLKTTITHIETVMNTYYYQEAAALE